MQVAETNKRDIIKEDVLYCGNRKYEDAKE